MATTDNVFPGFPSAPTRALFPLYGVAAVPGGKGYEVACMIRERTAAGITRDSGLDPQPVRVFPAQKPADDLALELNLRVWEAIQ